MKNLIILLCCFFLQSVYSQNADPVLFSIGDDKVHVSEFRYIYEKNNADKADYSKQSVEEYLELYKKFKLKVHKARDLGMDTIVSLQKELAGYRKQLANSYLKDKEISDRLIDEVLARSKEDRLVSHIFVSADAKMKAEDVAKAEKKINEIHAKLVENKGVGFGKMAKTISEDNISAKKEGLLGYYTAPLPDGFYQFENSMYDTPVGGFSEPVRSKMGFHILQVSDVRAARGEMEIAHILMRTPKGINGKNTKAVMDSLCKQIKSGVSFETLAGQYSEDKKTKDRGGYLGFFGVNQYEKSFEDAAFALTTDNSITEPIKTKVGYHIIKRLSKRDDADLPKARKRVEARINNNDRFSIAEEKLISDVKVDAGFQEDKALLHVFVNSLDESFYSYKWAPKSFSDQKEVLFKLGKKDYYLDDYATYVKENVRSRLKYQKKTPLSDAAAEIYDDYVKDEIIAYEESNLEEKYQDFRELMREYREGILLFEITKNEVWDKASQDTVGLKKFYESNKNNYRWPERMDLKKVEMASKDQKATKKAYELAKKKGLSKFLEKYEGDKTLFIKQSAETLESSMAKELRIKTKSGELSQLQSDGKSSYFYILNSLLPSRPKTLKEARGYVIADYQDHLEKEWVAQLKKENPIKVDKKVLSALIK